MIRESLGIFEKDYEKIMAIKQYSTSIALIATIFMWSSAFIAIRIGIEEYHAGSFALLRLAIAAICMFMIYLFKPPKKSLAKKDIVHGILLGVVGMAIYHAFLNLGEKTVTAGIASFIIAQVPVLTTLFAAIFLKEKIPNLALLGLCISLCGIILIAIGEVDQAQFDSGVLYIFISTIAASIYITSAKNLLSKMDSLYVTVFVVFGGALGTLIFLPQLITDLAQASSRSTMAAIYLGIFPTALAYLTYNYALSRILRSTAASWLYAMPLVTSFMGWLILGELPTFLAFIGGLLALGGVIVVNLVMLRGHRGN
jgi:drug/metabolite transporter (DMT)-like permease